MLDADLHQDTNWTGVIEATGLPYHPNVFHKSPDGLHRGKVVLSVECFYKQPEKVQWKEGLWFYACRLDPEYATVEVFLSGPGAPIPMEGTCCPNMAGAAFREQGSLAVIESSITIPIDWGKTNTNIDWNYWNRNPWTVGGSPTTTGGCSGFGSGTSVYKGSATSDISLDNAIAWDATTNTSGTYTLSQDGLITFVVNDPDIQQDAT